MGKKFVVFLLVCLLMITGVMPAFAAWDGYGNKNEADEQLTIVDMNKIGDIFNAGAVPSNAKKGSARYSAYWSDMVSVKSLMFNSVPRDWSDCDTIVIPIYSEKATDTEFMITVFCDWVPVAGTTVSYYSYRVSINWTGWKTFELSLSKDFSCINLADLSKVNYLRLTVDGWNCVASEDAKLYIDTIYCKRDATGDVTSSAPYTQSDLSAYHQLAENGYAVVPYSRNVLHKANNTPMDAENSAARVVLHNNKAYVPEAFFKDCFNAVPKASDEDFNENGLRFVPLTETAEALSIPYKAYNNFYVLGDGVDYDTLEANETARSAGAYAVCAMTGEKVPDAHFDAVKAAWRRKLVGDETNDTTDAIVGKAIQAITQKGQNAWNLMKKNASDDSILFLKIETTADMTQSYVYIAQMAKAYGTYGSALYQNKKLKRDIMSALEWMYQHYYGAAEIKGTGWRNTSLYNWWDWFVGTPMQLTDTLMILYDEMNQADVLKYLSPYDYFMETMGPNQDGASRLSAGTATAVLEHNTEQLEKCLYDFDSLMRLTPAEKYVDGLKEDGTYIEHELHPYNAGYGVSLIAERAMVVYGVFSQTDIAIPSPNVSNLLFATYETFEPILYNGGLMSALLGRRTIDEQTNANNLIASLLDLIGIFGEEHDVHIKAMIKRNISDWNLSAITNLLTVRQAATLANLLADETISAESDYEQAKVYYNGDVVVQQRNGYAVALAMNSERIANYESINGLNLTGWYQSDGALYLYTDKDYKQFGPNWWTNRNPYHMPGTTVDTQEREAKSIYYKDVYTSSQDFVGGVELGEFATAAMALESFHNEKDSGIVDVGYGGAQPLHESTLTAKKSYFFFDDEVVCLGADVNAKDGFEVQTVLANRHLTKNITKNASVSELKITSLVSAGDDGNVIANVQDNDLETRWSLEGTENCWFIAELAEPSEIGYAGLAFFSAVNGNAAIFDLEVSTDGENWENAFSGQSSGEKTTMEAFPMSGKTAKYVRFNGHGRLKSRWNSVTEFKLYPPTSDGSMPTAFAESSDTLYGSDDITVGNQLMPKESSYEKTIENPGWAHIEGVGGYWLPGLPTLQLKKTEGSNSFLEMWISHGVSPLAGTYSYALLPTATAEETAAYSQNPDVTILANNGSMQAARDVKAGLTGMAFWSAGSCEDITASAPMLVMQKTDGETRMLAVSDPTGKLGTAELTISGEYEPMMSDERITATVQNGTTHLSIRFDGLTGKTLSVKLKAK